jgi:hypothetical protein
MNVIKKKDRDARLVELTDITTSRLDELRVISSRLIDALRKSRDAVNYLALQTERTHESASHWARVAADIDALIAEALTKTA